MSRVVAGIVGGDVDNLVVRIRNAISFMIRIPRSKTVRRCNISNRTTVMIEDYAFPIQIPLFIVIRCESVGHHGRIGEAQIHPEPVFNIADIEIRLRSRHVDIQREFYIRICIFAVVA